MDCIVAPYEADAQLAYLMKAGLTQAIISEDSDLLVYGCQKVVPNLLSVARPANILFLQSFGTGVQSKMMGLVTNGMLSKMRGLVTSLLKLVTKPIILNHAPVRKKTKKQKSRFANYTLC